MSADVVIAGIRLALRAGAATADVVAVEARLHSASTTGGSKLLDSPVEHAPNRERRVVILTQRRLADPVAVIAGP